MRSGRLKSHFADKFLYLQHSPNLTHHADGKQSGPGGKPTDCTLSTTTDNPGAPQRLRTNAFLYIAGRMANLLLAPVTLIILPGYLGEQAYGQFSYWFYLLSIYIVIIDLGSQPLLRRYLPELRHQKPSSAYTLFIKTQAVKLTLFILFLASLLFLKSSWITALLVLAAFIAALCINLADIAYAFQHMGLHTLPILSRRLFRILLVPMFYLLWGVNGIIAALLTVELLALLLSLPAFKLLSKNRASLDKGLAFYYKVGLLVFTGFLLSTLIGRSPLIVAKWTGLDYAQLGRLALCIDITYFMLKELVHAVSESLFPQLIEYKSRRQFDKFKALFALNMRIINTATAAFAILGIALAPGLLGLLGGDYYRAAPVLQILLPGVIFSCWALLYNHFLIIMDKSLWVLASQLAGLLLLWAGIGLFFISNPTLILLATLLVAALLLTAAVSYLGAKRIQKQSFSLDIGFPWYFLKQLLIAGIIASGLYAWGPSGILQCLAAGILGLAAYLALVYFTRLLPESDLLYLKGLLLHRKNR